MGEVLGSESGTKVGFYYGRQGGNISVKLEGYPLGKLLGIYVVTEIVSYLRMSDREL